MNTEYYYCETCKEVLKESECSVINLESIPFEFQGQRGFSVQCDIGCGVGHEVERCYPCADCHAQLRDGESEFCKQCGEKYGE